MDWRDKVKEVEYICLSGRWYVRPAGTLGTCGFHPVPWELQWVGKARDANDAVRRATDGR